MRRVRYRNLPCALVYLVAGSDVTVSVNVLPALHITSVGIRHRQRSNISCQDAETETITILVGYTNGETGACEISGLMERLMITSPAFDECGGTLVITYPAPTSACGSLPDITVKA